METPTHHVFHMDTLTANTNVKSAGRRVQCDWEDCEASFTTKSHLRRHLQTHLKLKPFTCSICDKSFSRKDNLRQHYQIHKRKSINLLKLNTKPKYRTETEHISHPSSESVDSANVSSWDLESPVSSVVTPTAESPSIKDFPISEHSYMIPTFNDLKADSVQYSSCLLSPGLIMNEAPALATSSLNFLSPFHALTNNFTPTENYLDLSNSFNSSQYQYNPISTNIYPVQAPSAPFFSQNMGHMIVGAFPSNFSLMNSNIFSHSDLNLSLPSVAAQNAFLMDSRFVHPVFFKGQMPFDDFSVADGGSKAGHSFI
ncbi:hypothetical protein HK096_006383 [Nowakowskiella sp. JEL0078]|nr:hypothetical protein HK096_006383 [Nowakowskiella sp. JEL0078]